MRLPGGPQDRGAVTVEAAIAVCTIVVVLTAAVATVLATVAYLRCTDAAREAARLVARGEADRAHPAAAELAPRDADVSIVIHGDEVRVDVSTSLIVGWQAAPRLVASAVAVLEPGVGDPSGTDSADGKRAVPDPEITAPPARQSPPAEARDPPLPAEPAR